MSRTTLAFGFIFCRGVTTGFLRRFIAAVFALLPLLASAETPPPASSPGPGPRWTDSQKARQRDAALSLSADLQAAIARGAKSYTIPPGDYRFDGKAGKNVNLSGLNDFLLGATGATFWFDPQFGVHLDRCQNVEVRGLTIDTDPPPWAQGVIERIDPSSGAIQFVIDPGYLVPSSDTLQKRWRSLFFDPATGNEIHVFDDHTSSLELTGDRRVVAKFASGRVFQSPVYPRPVRVGDKMVLLPPFYGGGNIGLKNCRHVMLHSVTLYGAAGFAFHEEEGEGGNHYLQCRLIRRPDSNRLMASKADGLHSFLMKKGPLIEQCEISHTGDDMVALHGFFAMAVEPSSGQSIVIATPFGRNVAAGSVLRFYHPPDGALIGEAVVKDVTPVADPAKLDEARHLPDLLKTSKGVKLRSLEQLDVVQANLDREVSVQTCDLVASSDFCDAGAVVRDNYIHDGHIRGILAKTSDLVVENNRIERTSNGGIVLEPELYWLEGPFNRRIRITGNHLADNGWSAFDSVGMTASMAAIQVGEHFGKRLFPRTLQRGTPNEEIVIQGNDIVRPAGFAILVMNASGIRIVRNHIAEPFAAGENSAFFDFSHLLAPGWKATPDEQQILKAPYYPIYLQSVENVVLEGNQIDSAPSFVRGEIGHGPEAK